MNTLAERLKHYWLSYGLSVGPGASLEAIAAFEAKYGVLVPEDLRDYFLVVNGTGGDWDDELVDWYPLHRWQTIPEADWPSYGFPNLESWFVFADYCLHGWAYAIRLSGATSEPNPVIILYEQPHVIAQSFSELLEAYLTDTDILLSYPL